MPVGLQQAFRLRHPRPGGGGRVVYNVAPVAGEFHTINGFGGFRAGFGVLPGDPAQFDYGFFAGKTQHHSHLQDNLEGFADGRRVATFKFFSAIAPLQQKSLALLGLAQQPLEAGDLARKNQGGKGF